MLIRFWGVRGSIACAGARFIRYGGNTSCVELDAGRTRIIFDAGTGIRELGASLERDGVKKSTLFLTHTHWDHINGFPFFGPAYRKGFALEVYAGHLSDMPGGVRSALAGQMAEPMFPVPLEVMQSAPRFHDFNPGDGFRLAPGVQVETARLNHPNGATGYRVEHGGKAVCYVTDTEHVPGKPDEAILGLIAGADLVIYDSTYTDAEFHAKVSWGHSTWQEGVRLCRAAGAKRLAIFHHDPGHDDPFMKGVEKDAAKMWKGAFVAREGMSVDV